MTRLLLLVVAAALAGAGAGYAQRPDSLIGERLRARIDAASTPLYERTAVAGFYARRGFRPAWNNEHGPNRLADDLFSAIERADLEGLRPADYHLADIRAVLDSVRDDAANGRPNDPNRLAQLDLLLTDAFLLYGSHLLSGRVDPATLHPRWEANRRGADLATVLDEALASRKVARALQRLAPTQDGYRLLREALQREQAVAAEGGWPTIAPGPVLKRGDHAPAVALLRQRLRLEGDLRESEDRKTDDPLSFDTRLEVAVQRFQTRHALDATGTVNAATRAELNVSAERRVAQLRLNLERWRWLPQDLGRRYILVNIAGYQLEVVEDEEVVLDMRVVVGRQYRRTPVFSDTVRYLVLNPYWNVPRKIAVEDLLPKIQSDPSYIERHGMRVFEGSAPEQLDPTSIDWSSVTPDNFNYRLHQEPGRLNALGRIKFMFPNSYDVYLHDTPSRDHFQESQRDFSSGCIRIERPIDLAVYLMKKGRWNRDAVEQALDDGAERTLYLPKPIPIHLLYWTAWASEDGVIEFRPDINEVDRSLAEALDAPIPRGETKRD